MKPVQGPEDFVLPDVAAFAPPVLRVFDEVADRQSDIGFERGEHADHATTATDLHVQPLLAVGRGNPLLDTFVL